MAASRTDLATGIVLLGCSYAAAWVVRRRPRTRAERFVVGARRAGHATGVAAVALGRVALAEVERAARAQRPDGDRGRS